MENQEIVPTGTKKEKSLLARVWGSISVPLVSVVLSMVIGGIILWVSGANPIAAYAALFRGAFAGDGLGRTLEKATPLLFSGLAVSFAFKGRAF